MTDLTFYKCLTLQNLPVAVFTLYAIQTWMNESLRGISSSSPRELCRFDDRKIELFSPPAPPAPPAPSASPASPHPAILGCSSTSSVSKK